MQSARALHLARILHLKQANFGYKTNVQFILHNQKLFVVVLMTSMPNKHRIFFCFDTRVQLRPTTSCFVDNLIAQMISANRARSVVQFRCAWKCAFRVAIKQNVRTVRKASNGRTVNHLLSLLYFKTSNESRLCVFVHHMNDKLTLLLNPLSKSSSSSEDGNPVHAFVV